MVERDDPAGLKQTTRREHQQPLRAMPPSQPYAWPDPRNAQKNSTSHAVRPHGSTTISAESWGSWWGMDRETIMDDYVEAVRQLDISERQVAEQQRIVDLLTEFGRDTTAAREQLMALERAHAHNMDRRNQLRALLEQ